MAEKSASISVSHAISVTHPSAPHDGFGEQIKLVIYTMLFAEMNQLKYKYTPLSSMAHNYNNSPDFVSAKETFLGWLDRFAAAGLVVSTNGDGSPTPKVNLFDLLHFVVTNIDKLATSPSLAQLRKWFWATQETPVLVSPRRHRIVLHIRQGNPHDRHAASFQLPWSIYAEIISHLRRLYGSGPTEYTLEIISQGSLPADITDSVDAVYLDETLETSFMRMVTADILVVGPSAFSYAAALLSRPSRTLVYYIPHCNPPLPNWQVIQNLTTPRMHFEYIIPMTVWFDAARNSFRPGYEAGFPFRVVTDLCRWVPPATGAPDRFPFNGNPDFGDICTDYIRGFGVNTVIETGTYLGRTTEFFAKCPGIITTHSIESNLEYFEKAQTNLMAAGTTNSATLTLHHGDSAVILPDILTQNIPPTASPRILFYLDAHWERACPLLAELGAIAASGISRDNCLIIIDDFRIPHRPDIPFDVFGGRPLDINYVREALTAVFPNNLHYEYYAPPRRLAPTRGRLVAYPSSWEGGGVTKPGGIISQT